MARAAVHPAGSILAETGTMNSIVSIVGLVVIVLAILGFLGFR